ncbi:MAG: hypothetical protein M1343_02290 [Chloroflexi bacterium]|nr:hypothetical protein [Chloroflexota bacterium]MDA8188421.1 hypothetical protein [Dehalococcoidales bacterium]
MKLKLLIGALAVGLIVSLAGTALVLADEPAKPAANGFYDQFISKLATALGKSEQDTRNAIAQAEKDVVQDAVKSGKMTQSQADRINDRIDKGGLPFFQRPGWAGHRPKDKEWMHRGPFIRSQNDIAGFLGIQPADLRKELRQGKSLAQVAADHGKSRDDLKTFIVNDAKSKLDKAVTDGKLTQDKENAILKRLQDNLDKMIDRTWKAPHKPRKQQS